LLGAVCVFAFLSYGVIAARDLAELGWGQTKVC
jgi:hypothetical protein